MAQDIGRFFKHSTIYAVGNVLNRVGSFVLLPLYTRLLSTAEYGALESLYVISAIASGILAVGISHATLRFYFAYDNAEDRRRVVSTNFLASMAISAVGGLLLLPVEPYVQDSMASIPTFGHAYRWMVATIVFELSSQVCLALVRAEEKSLLFIAVSVLKLLIQVAANSIALLKFNAGVDGVMAGNFLTVVAGWLLLGIYTVRRCGLGFEWAKLMPVLKYSYPFLVTTVIGIAASAGDRLMLQYLVSIEALGVYALATKFSKLISDLVGEPVNRAYGAFRFTIIGQANAATLQADITRYLAILLSMTGLGVVAFTPHLLRVMSSEAYLEATVYLPVLVTAAVLNVLTYPLQTGILYAKATRELVKVSTVQSVVAAVVGLGLIYLLGIMGACIAVLASTVAALVMTNRLSQRYFQVAYPVAPFVKMAMLAGLVMLSCRLLDGQIDAIALPIKVGLMLLYPALLIVVGVVTRDELALGRRFLAKVLPQRNPETPA